MQKKRSSDLVLGVMVTNRMLHAVLLQGEGYWCEGASQIYPSTSYKSFSGGTDVKRA